MEGVILPDGEYDDLVLQLRVVSRAACAGPCGRTTVKSRAVRRVWVVRAPDSASVCVYLFNKQSRGGLLRTLTMGALSGSRSGHMR